MIAKPQKSFAFAALLLCTAIALSACKKSTPEANNAPNDNLRVSVPESLQAQIQVSEVVNQDVSDTLRVAGQIDFDEQALTRIGASVTGRVTQIHATLGQQRRHACSDQQQRALWFTVGVFESSFGDRTPSTKPRACENLV